MRRTTVMVVTVLVIVGLAKGVLGCTTFCMKSKGENLFGKNYDWHVGAGVVFVNKRGVSKWSSLDEEGSVAKWTSKYGSVTFNQYGWESPSGGMNEAGLAIELMWLDGTRYPADRNVPAIDVTEWIQYQLDVSATTAELMKNSGNVRISSEIPLHFLVNDKAGVTATIEFLDGKLVPHTGNDLPVATLTNNTYSESLNFAKGKDPARTLGYGSFERFARASARTKAFGEKELAEKEAVDFAFATLADAAQGPHTKWSIVYDQNRHKIHYRTLANNRIRTIDARAFDYSCSAPVMMLDIDQGSGDVTRSFVPYTRTINRDLIERSFNGTDFLKSVPPKTRDAYTDFPERFGCNGVVKPTVQPAVKSRHVSLLELVIPAFYVYNSLTHS